MKFDDIYIGQRESLSHTIIQKDIDSFVELTGDDNRLHVDKEFAAATSFKKPVAHGMLGASFISTIIGTKLPGDGALWFSQTLEFLLPVRVGDVITVTAEVIKKYQRDRVVELNVEITNQNRQIVTRGTSKVKLVETEVNTEYKIEHQACKVALVVGATGGIGSATCLQLAKSGFDLIIHYNKNKEKAEYLKREVLKLGKGGACTIAADINNKDQIQELVRLGTRKFGHIDMFVNCASSPIPSIKVFDLVWDDFLIQLELNIKVNLEFVKELVPSMTDRKYGKFIFISSVFTDKPNLNLSHYITAKSALEGFVKSLALELGPKGIQVNLVSPSIISTELTADIPEKMKLMTAAQTPLRRLAVPEDVAEVIDFLANDKLTFLTGENIRLNGGLVMI